MKFLTILISIIFLTACSPSNKDWIEERAEAKWNKQGYEVIDYEGFQWGFLGFGTPYGGAKVWHRLRKSGGSNTTYSGYLTRWGDEVHVYGAWMNEGETLQSHEGININL